MKRCEWFFMGLGKLDQRGGRRKVAENLVSAYAEAEGEGSGAAPKGSPQHIWNRLASDLAFGASTVMVAGRQSKHNPDHTWTYRFDGFSNRNAFHGWELGLIFGTLLNEQNAEIKAFADGMRDYFSRFIATADPNGISGLPEWPPWSASSGNQQPDGVVMHFDRQRFFAEDYSDAAPAMGQVVKMIDTAFFHESIS